jgi:uncharacterized membrane protein
VLQEVGRFLLLSHKKGSQRYWELDALRGLAITLMVAYHAAYDLTHFGYYHANVFVGGWRIFGRTSAILFLLLVGCSLAISYARTPRPTHDWGVWKRYLVRGLKLWGWGMVITAFTWIYTGQPVILFGILHLIGVSTILAYPFLWLGSLSRRSHWILLPVSLILIFLGIRLNAIPIGHPWLMWLGLRPPSLYQMDYFPLLPWLGVVLLGIFTGQVCYPFGQPGFALPDLVNRSGIRQLVWLGRRSLIIYLLHQPVLFIVFSALKGFNPG